MSAPIDRYAGVDDPFEVLRRWFTRPRPDGVVRLDPSAPIHEYCARIDVDDARRLVALAAELVRGDAYGAADAASTLACFLVVAVDLRPLQEALLARPRLRASHAFHGAHADVREALFARLAAVEGGERRQTLEALAWVGDDEVVARLAALRAAPPVWLGELRGGLETHVRAAGWELTDDGRRRELSSERCIALVPRADGDAVPVDAPVRVCAPRADACGACGRALTDMLRLQEPAGALVVAACVPCLEQGGRHYAEFDRDGRARWSVHTTAVRLPVGTYDPLEPDPLVAGPRRSPRFAVDWALEPPMSQVGGLPGWVQHEAYPECPGCRRTMRFVAQLDAEYLAEAEGVYYAFACRRCGLSSVDYQCS